MELNVAIADGLIHQYSQTGGLGPVAGCEVCTLTDDQATQYMMLLATPNSGITFIDSVFTALPVPPPPVIPTPTAHPGANAGGKAHAALLPDSTDILGSVTLTAGSAPTIGDMVDIVFGTPMAKPPMLIALQPMNAPAGVLYAANVTITGFSICSMTPPIAGKQYTVSWQVQG